MITDPTVIRFSNEKIRASSDKYVQLYNWAKNVVNLYVAQDIGNLISGDEAEVLDDGSSVDGRPLITGQDLLNVITNLQTFISTSEANSNAILNIFAKAAVNT
jgi:hypothetical protein